MVNVTTSQFLKDRQGSKFADVVNDPALPFDTVVAFFADENRQRRLEESELHHDRAPLAGVVRELEADPAIAAFLTAEGGRRGKRLRQAIGVLVRIVMEARGWRKTGKKGSLGVRAVPSTTTLTHNTGGLALWFIRAERYEPQDGMPYRSVKDRCVELEAAESRRRPSRPKRKAERS